MIPSGAVRGQLIIVSRTKRHSVCGVIVPLTTNYNGLKFISPNDVCVKSDGSIWFTDTGSDSGISLGARGCLSDECRKVFSAAVELIA